MFLKKVFFILLPLIALVNGQSAARDWRFRRPVRFPPRVIHRPIQVARPTTFSPSPDKTTEPSHVTVSTTHWPSSTHPPSIRPSFNRRPTSAWSRPFPPSSSTQKPAVTVIVLPGSHTHAPSTTIRPYYIYPERPTAKPVDIPLLHEMEPLYTKPVSKPLIEPIELSSSKPVTLASEPEVSSSTKPFIKDKPNSESQSVSTLQSSPKPEQVISPVSELQSEVKPETKPESHNIEPKEPLKPSIEPEVETKPEPQIESKPESSKPPLGDSTERFSEVSQSKPIPSSTPEFKPTSLPELAPSLAPEFESSSEFVSSSAPVSSDPSHETATSTAFLTTQESELLDPLAASSNSIRLKYIPGIGNSRNPISATWSKPSWIPKPTKKPEHPNPWKATPAPKFHLPSRTSTNWADTTSSQRPVYVPKPMARTHTRDPFALMDYHCREPTGYFAVPTQCDAFIECKSNRARQTNCPDGLHFNPKAVWPEYPCAYPSEVKCAAHYEIQEAKPTAECPRQYGYFESPSGDCGQYLMCLEGKATKMTCPTGLAFNLKTTACDWPANVPSCNPDVFKGFTCPVPEIGENGKPSDVIYKYRYGNSCKKYIACQRGSPRLLSCDEGLSYDHETQSCMDDEFVKDCS